MEYYGIEVLCRRLVVNTFLIDISVHSPCEAARTSMTVSHSIENRRKVNVVMSEKQGSKHFPPS